MKDESGQHTEADANALSPIPDLREMGGGFNSLQVWNDGIAIMQNSNAAASDAYLEIWNFIMVETVNTIR